MKVASSFKVRYRPRVLLLLVAVVVTPLLSACEDGEQEAFLDLAVQWASAKGLISLSCEGPGDQNCTYELNETALGVYIGVGRIGAALSGDKKLGNALDAADVVLTQEKADDLVEQGAQSGDLDLIEQAIKSRPDDWSYIDNKAAVQLANGDLDETNKSFAKSEQIVKSRVNGGESCVKLSRNMLHHRIAAIEAQIQRTEGQSNAELHDRLADAHDQLAALESGGPGSPCP